MSSNRIDWSQLWYPGPKRRFTPEEMALAGADPPSRTFYAVAALNAAMLAFLVLILAPHHQQARLLGLMVLLGMGGWVAARWLWWRPWRGPLMRASLAVSGALIAVAWGLRWRIPERDDRLLMALVLSVGCSVLVVMLWFLVVWRAQRIESRLTEIAEREQAVEMARRLAAAQIEPHFLFNTLASLQHWVDTRDARASTLLGALTGYLRATLPMFRRPTQPLADELVAVEHYLRVMQARLGTRLAFGIDMPEPLGTLALPSGVLLTLVENAVQHGVEPSLAGGRVDIRARREGEAVRIEVVDDGPGPAPDAVDGIGLTNVRQRLALLSSGASFVLERAGATGCVARLVLPPIAAKEKP